MKYVASENMLKITVKDTGIGIKQNDRSKLFNLFGKLEATAKINTSGVGLGLSICMKIVQVYGGTIYLEDSDEKGSAFTFTIRCGEPDSEPDNFELPRKMTQIKHQEENKSNNINNLIEDQ